MSMQLHSLFKHNQNYYKMFASSDANIVDITIYEFMKKCFSALCNSGQINWLKFML